LETSRLKQNKYFYFFLKTTFYIALQITTIILPPKMESYDLDLLEMQITEINSEELLDTATEKQFWTNYFFQTFPEEEDDMSYMNIDVRLMVNGNRDFAFGLDLRDCMIDIKLTINTSGGKDEIGCDDGTTYRPALRWEELDVICRAIAQQNPKLPHPGLPLLFLYRFAPICVGDDVDAITTQLEKAWKDTGLFSDSEIQGLIEKYDARDALFQWHWNDESKFWWLGQNSEQEGATADLVLHTDRHQDSADSFPHKNFAALIRAAKATAKIEDEEAPSGSTSSSKRQALEQAARPSKKLRTKYGLKLDMDFTHPTRTIQASDVIIDSTLNRILRSLNLGKVDYPEIITGTDANGQLMVLKNRLPIQIVGDLDQGLKLIQKTLQWAQAPETVTLRDAKSAKIELNMTEVYDDQSLFAQEYFRLCPRKMRWLGDGTWLVCMDAMETKEAKGMISTHDSDITIEQEKQKAFYKISAADGGQLRIHVHHAHDEYSNMIVTLVKRSRMCSNFLHRLMNANDLIMLPPGIMTTPVAPDVPQKLLIRTHVVDSEDAFHDILEGGPSGWWNRGS
jgi:hypothetical protein